MDLSSLKPAPGAVKKRKRLGRGPGSGHGKTSGRGHKGRGARSGGNTIPGFEGGQMPLQRRLPKRGFHNPFRKEFCVVNIRDLELRFDAGVEVTPEALEAKGLVRKGCPVKVLGDGKLSKSFRVVAHAFSASAKERIAAAGGSTEVIAGA